MTEELNRRHNLATMPTINNNGESYIVPFDIYKEGYDAYDISNWFKGRVGDNGTPFGIRWYKHGQLMDVTGMRPFIEGQVGDYTIDDSDPDDPKINMDSEASNVHVVGEVNDCQEYGVAIYRLINQAMPQSGIFYGKIGVMGTQDDGTTVMSSVDVVFKVLAGHMSMVGARKFYVSELEKALLDFKAKIKQHDQEYATLLEKHNQEFQDTTNKALNKLETDYINIAKNAHDSAIAGQAEIDAERENATNLAGRVSDMLTQIKDNDIVTVHTHNEDLSKISTAINDRLAKMKTGPVGVSDVQTLQNTYPNGADGLFVTLDNKHLYMWLNGQWSDAGPYETAQLDKQVEQSIGDVKSAVLKENLIKNGSFSDGTLDGTWGDLGSDKLHIFNFSNRNWACLQSDTAEAYHGFNWWIDNPLKNLGQNYPLHIEFDLVTAQPMTLNVNLVPIDHENNRLGGMTIKTITTNSWEFKHFDVDFGIDDKYITADHFYFQIVQNAAKPVQEMRVTGVICYLKYHKITNLCGNLIENGDFSNGLAYPAYSNTGDGKLAIMEFTNQKWLDFSSELKKVYQGIDWKIDNPLKTLGQNYPLSFKLKLGTSTNSNLRVNLMAYDGQNQNIGGQIVDQIKTKAWRFVDKTITINVNPDYIGADHFILQIVQPDALSIDHLRVTDLDCRVLFDTSIDTYGNAIANGDYSSGAIDSSVFSNTGKGNLSVIDFAKRKWLSFSNSNKDAYQGINWELDNVMGQLGQIYPLHVSFDLITAQSMTLQADLIGYDSSGKQVGLQLIQRFTTKAWRAIKYKYDLQLTPDLLNATTLRLQLVQPDAKPVQEMRITDVKAMVNYDKSTNIQNDLITNGSFSDGTTHPSWGNLEDDKLAVTNYIGKNWLKITNANANAQWGGINWELVNDQSYFDAPLEIKFDLMTAEDMTLNLNAIFLDDKGQRMGGNAGGQIIDQIKTKASQIIHYSNRFKFDQKYKDASLIHIQLLNYEQKPIKQLIITNVSLKSKFDNLKIDTVHVPTIDELEQQYGLPIMMIDGDLSGMDHDHAKNITYNYKNKNTHLSGYGTVKWQGSSSATLAKKGYRLKTTKSDYSEKDKIRVQPSWQKHHKFNLKAYYNDGMLSRDPVSANIGAKVSASRSELPRDLIHEDNFGYIDGFPIILFINNEYQGIYSFNLPRPEFSYTKWAIMGNQYNDTTQFVAVPTDGVKLDGSDFVSLNPEDTPTDEEKKAVTDLFKWMVNSTDDEFKRDLDKHFNIPSLIDYVVVSNILGDRDAAGKNQILMTWDGKIWYYQLYDLDCTYNANWMGGKTFDTPKVGVDLPFLGNNQFLLRFAKLYHNAIADRYRDVRQWCTPGYILSLYKQRINLIGQGNFEEEWAKWNDPSKDTEDFKQLQNDLYDHFKAADFVWLGNNPENTTYQIKPDTPPAPQTQPVEPKKDSDK